MPLDWGWLCGGLLQYRSMLLALAACVLHRTAVAPSHHLVPRCGTPLAVLHRTAVASRSPGSPRFAHPGSALTCEVLHPEWVRQVTVCVWTTCEPPLPLLLPGCAMPLWCIASCGDRSPVPCHIRVTSVAGGRTRPAYQQTLTPNPSLLTAKSKNRALSFGGWSCNWLRT